VRLGAEKVPDRLRVAMADDPAQGYVLLQQHRSENQTRRQKKQQQQQRGWMHRLTAEILCCWARDGGGRGYVHWVVAVALDSNGIVGGGGVPCAVAV
jgi:hypothetical protein